MISIYIIIIQIILRTNNIIYKKRYHIIYIYYNTLIYYEFI